MPCRLTKKKTVIRADAVVPIYAFAIPGFLAIECAMHQHIQASGATPKVKVKIDARLKKKCPRTALACVTARVEAGASPAALLQEMHTREKEAPKFPFPRGVPAPPPSSPPP